MRGEAVIAVSEIVSDVFIFGSLTIGTLWLLWLGMAAVISYLWVEK